MTDRYKGFAVALEADIRDDDAQATLNAIRQVKGVLSAEPVMAEGMSETITIMRVKQEMISGLIHLIEELRKDGV